MSFFNDNDPFENIVREFFGQSPASERGRRKTERVIEGEREEREIDFVETKNKTFLVFELPGYDKKDILITFKGKHIEISAEKKSSDKGEIQSYLSQKLGRGILIQKELPKFIKTKNFEYTVKNGILEISFNK